MIVMRTPRLRRVLRVFGCIALPGYLLYCVGPWLGESYRPLQVLSVVVLVWGSFLGGMMLRKTLRDELALVIDRLGIIENSGMIGAGRIFWEEIKDFRLGARGTVRVVWIDVDERAALYAGRPVRAVARRRSVPVYESSLDRPVEAVFALLQRYRRSPELRDRELGVYGLEERRRGE